MLSFTASQSSDIGAILNVNHEQASSAVSAAKELFTNANSSIKTPISLLQEICMKCHVQPIYEVLSAEGQIHEPTFVYKVTVGDLSEIGKGTSKKRAKHMAALAILNEIKARSVGKNDELAAQIESLIQLVSSPDTTMMSDDTSSKISPLDSTVDTQQQQGGDASNPVGELLELTQKYSIRPPVFEFGAEEGPPHNRQFVCNVTLGDYKEIGMGRAKKDAKRQAALKLLAKIKSSNNLDMSSSKDADLKEDAALFGNGAAVAAAASAAGSKDKRFHNNKNLQSSFNLFKNSDKPSIKNLLANDLTGDEDHYTYLDDIANELSFEISYFQIPVISKSGQCQVLLQLQIHPLTVIHGSGQALDAAKKQAAFNALSYIKLMCAK